MPEPEAELQRAFERIVAEARAQVADRREPNMAGLEARVATAARRARSNGANAAEVERAEAEARRQLQTIASVHRARALLAREPLTPKPGAPSFRRPVVFRTKPTITGTLDIRREKGQGFRLVWDAVPAVTEWEVRFSERQNQRSDYVESAALVLAGGETNIEVPLGDNPFRVNILGRGRGGRLQRRALISGLTRNGWGEPWQRRSGASGA
jgi:hypothetical protein